MNDLNLLKVKEVLRSHVPAMRAHLSDLFEIHGPYYMPGYAKQVIACDFYIYDSGWDFYGEHVVLCTVDEIDRIEEIVLEAMCGFEIGARTAEYCGWIQNPCMTPRKSA